MKEFAVVGLGNFGATVARELSRLKCRVTAIDNDENRVQAIKDSTDTAIVADATEREFWQNIEVDKFDCFVISTGENTHASILVTLFLTEMNAKKIIVKAKSEDHARVLRKVGASQTVIPEKQMAAKIAHSLAEFNILDYLPLTGNYYVAEVPPLPRFVGNSLADLKMSSKYRVQVVAVKDSNTEQLSFAPGGEYVIRETDVLIVLGEDKDIEKLK